jgi:hypothetical protein
VTPPALMTNSAGIFASPKVRPYATRAHVRGGGLSRVVSARLRRRSGCTGAAALPLAAGGVNAGTRAGNAGSASPPVAPQLGTRRFLTHGVGGVEETS